ncbi:SLAM family member 7-like isoform 2-T2 [Discoglossus pictus]
MFFRLICLLTIWGIAMSDDAQDLVQDLSGTFGGTVIFPVNIEKQTEVTSVWWIRVFADKRSSMLAIEKDDTLDVKADNAKDRLHIQAPGHSLSMDKLEAGDSGIYKATVYTSDITLKFTYKLHVNADVEGNRRDSGEAAADGAKNPQDSGEAGKSWTWMNIFTGVIIVILFVEGRT